MQDTKANYQAVTVSDVNAAALQMTPLQTSFEDIECLGENVLVRRVPHAPALGWDGGELWSTIPWKEVIAISTEGFIPPKERPEILNSLKVSIRLRLKPGELKNKIITVLAIDDTRTLAMYKGLSKLWNAWIERNPSNKDN